MLFELQQYLRHAAAHGRTTLRSGPFRVHLDAHDDQPYANYAIPDDGAQPSAAEVAALVRAFGEEGRRPAFEYLPACAPAVEPLLLAAGLEVTRRIPLLTCPAERVVTVPAPAGVSIALATPEIGDGLARELLSVQYAAFGMPGAVLADADVERLRGSAADGVVAYALADGAVVGGGSAPVLRDGLAELAGIAVAEPMRRRGIAAALTSALATEAVVRGVRLPFLTPGDDHADRAYRRAGFAPAGEMLHLAAPEPAG